MSKLSFSLSMIVMILSLGPSSAFGAGTRKDDAKKHFSTGLSLLEVEDFNGAALEFETSTQLYPTKNGLFNLANCYKALHRYGEALDTIETLKKSFANELDNEWKSEIDNFTAALKKIVAHLQIDVNVDGATIYVNGTQVGVSPLPKKIIGGPGLYKISVEKKRFQPQTKEIQLISGQNKQAHFELISAFGELKLQVAPRGATIFVDNEKIGIAPIINELALPTGDHFVKVEKNGHASQEKEVRILPGSQTQLNISLQVSSRKTSTVLPPPQTRELSTALAFESKPTQASTALSPKAKRLKIMGITSIVIGAVAAGTGGALFIVSGNKQQEYDKLKRDYDRALETLENTETPTATQLNDVQNISDAMNSEKRQKESLISGGAVSMICAGAFLTTGIVLLVRSKKIDHHKNETHAIVSPFGLEFPF